MTTGKRTIRRAPLAEPFALGPDAPAVHLDGAADDVEPEARLLVCRGVVGGPAERIEDEGQDLGRDASPRVLDGEPRVLAVALEHDDDVSALRRELQRIGEQIREHLLEARAIAEDDDVVGHDRVELEAALAGDGHDHRDAAAYELAEIEGDPFELPLVGGHAGNVE